VLSAPLRRSPNLHQTINDNAATALATLTDRRRKVSAHYLIGRDGALVQLVDEASRAWHAGESWWGGNTDLNSASISRAVTPMPNRQPASRPCCTACCKRNCYLNRAARRTPPSRSKT